MESRIIEFLDTNDFKVFKVIEVVGPSWNKFRGYIPYLRTVNLAEYDLITGDQLDQRILSVVQSTFPGSRFLISEHIVFKGQLESLLDNIEGGTRKNFTIQLFPLIPFAEVPNILRNTFKAYPIGFSMRLYLGEQSDMIQQINNYLICHYDFTTIDDIVKTITPLG